MSEIETCETTVIHEEVVNTVRQTVKSKQELQLLSQIFKVFGDETRLRIMDALLQSQLCVCDLANLLDMTQSAISHQLKVLRQANLVQADKQGKIVYYSLADDHVKRILEIGLEHLQERGDV